MKLTYNAINLLICINCLTLKQQGHNALKRCDQSRVFYSSANSFILQNITSLLFHQFPIARKKLQNQFVALSIEE